MIIPQTLSHNMGYFNPSTLSCFPIPGLSFLLSLVMTFCPYGEKNYKDRHICFQKSLCLARPQTTVITLSQTKLTGNLGWEKNEEAGPIFRFQGQPVRFEWKSRQPYREQPWRKECRQPCEHWGCSIMKHYVPLRPISPGSQPSSAAKLLH